MARSLRERFDDTRRWGTFRQVAVGLGLSVAAGVGVSALPIAPPPSVQDRPQAAAAPAPTTSTSTTSSPASMAPTTSSTTTSPPTATTALQTTTVAPTPVPTTSAPPPDPLPATAGQLVAADVLAAIPVELEYRGDLTYNRDLFAVWIDAAGNGCDTRAEVLLSETLTSPVAGLGCGTVEGAWISAYDGLTTTDPGDLDVDHVVSLKETWDSGAWEWSPARRIAFGNDLTDPRTLIAVSSSSNRTKGDRDPSNWLPRDEDVCRFVGDWIAIKARWDLAMDPSEHGRLGNLLADRCAGLLVGAWTTAPA